MDRLIIMLHSLRALRSRGAHNVKTLPNRASRTSDEASYVDNAAPTPLNMSPRPTSRVEERTVPSVDDGCYTWRDVKIVGILPVKEVEEPKDKDLRLVLHTYISHVLKIDLLSNSTLMKKSLSSSSSLNFEVTRIMHILCIIYRFCMHIFAPIMQKSA